MTERLRRHRWASPIAWLVVPILIFGGVAGYLTWRTNQQQEIAAAHDKAARERIDKLEATVTALAGALNTEQAATKVAGGQPVTPPAEALLQSPSATIPAPTPTPVIAVGKDGRDGRDGKDGAPGVQGPPPSDGQVLAAVTTYLVAHPPEGGKPPTPEQISAAVSMYCSSGACRGTDGAAGATGAQGPGPTDDQLAGAVAAFCGAHNGCVGAAGQQGAPGPAVGSWSWTFGATDYTCSDPDGDNAYTCTGTTPPP